MEAIAISKKVIRRKDATFDYKINRVMSIMGCFALLIRNPDDLLCRSIISNEQEINLKTPDNKQQSK